MNILIIGGGGREHAVALSVSKSKNVTRYIFFQGMLEQQK